MTGCRCSDGPNRRFGHGRSPLRSTRLALLTLTLAALLSARPALALSPPTDLTPPEAPASGTDQPLPPPPPSGNGASIESAPLPQPDMPPQEQPGAMGAQPMPQGATPQGAAQPTAAQPMPPAAMPPAPASIGADLGPNLWFGSQLSQLMALLPRLPAPVTVPSVRDLQLRLLTTQASPQGVSPGADPLAPTPRRKPSARPASPITPPTGLMRRDVVRRELD